MKFQIIAVDAGRNIVSLGLQAATASIARDTASKQGLTVLSVRSRALALPRLRGEAAFPISLFSIELMALLEAGLNLVEALQTLSEKEVIPNGRRSSPGYWTRSIGVSHFRMP
jgi:general secretion pathway protein F